MESFWEGDREPGESQEDEKFTDGRKNECKHPVVGTSIKTVKDEQMTVGLEQSGWGEDQEMWSDGYEGLDVWLSSATETGLCHWLTPHA